MTACSNEFDSPGTSSVRKVFQALGVALFSAALLLAIGMWLLASENSPLNRSSAIQKATSWARLEPLPASAKHIDIDVKGSSFTREFVITFQAPAEDILCWLAASPGTDGFEPTPGTTSAHRIKPTGEGATFARVVVFEDGETVKIRAYWS